MKIPVLFILCLVVSSPLLAQMQIDHPVQLTGSGVNAKITGIQNVSTPSDAVSADYIQKDSLKFAIATGGNNIYSVSLNPAITSLSTGMTLFFEANFSNTGASSLSVNNLDTIAIKKNYNVDLDSNDIQQGQMVSVIYDGANFQMLSQTPNNIPPAPSPQSGGLVLLYADESTSSATSNTNTIKSYNLASNNYSKIIIETEGGMSISVNGGFTCATTASIVVGGNNLKSSTFSRGVSNYDTWAIPFVVKTSTVQQSAATITVAGSFALDGGGSGTITVTSLRVYGVN